MSKKPQTEGYLDLIGRSGGKASVEVQRVEPGIEVLKLLREIAGRLDGLGEGQEHLHQSFDSLRKRSNENTETLLLAVRGVGSDVTQIELRLVSMMDRDFGE